MKPDSGALLPMRFDKPFGLRGLGASLALVVAFLVIGLAGNVRAAAPAAKEGVTLHVLRPIIKAERAKAEICLEFDHPVVAQGESGRVPPSLSLKLESQDRKQTFSARAATFSGNQICVSGLTHRVTYRLKLAAFRSPSNGKLGSPYSLSFTVPPRRASLAFTGNGGGAPLARWRENPVLRSMNVGEAKLELFRIKEPSRMAEAWSLRAQAVFAPSEMATFAHANGELVWQGSLPFDGRPDEGSEKQVPLPKDGESGLYLVVASAPNLLTKKTELVPISALWLLRSDLNVKLVQAEKGWYYALASDAGAARMPSGVVVTAYGRDFKKMAEARANASGIAFLPGRQGRGDSRKTDKAAGVVVAFDDRGHAGFADIGESASTSSDYVLPSSDSAMLVTRGAYAPGAAAEVILAIRDLRGKGLAIKGTQVRVLKGDGSVYASYPVPESENGKTRLSFPAPATEGIWPLVWRKSDGEELAKGTMKVTSSVNTPHLQVAADRGRLLPDGEVALTIRSQDPFVQGKAYVAWKRTENAFAGWDGYVFGASPREERRAGKFLTSSGAARPAIPFLTDEDGSARLFVRVAPPHAEENRDGSASSLWTAILSVEGERGAGIFDPLPLELPLKPTGFVVGIKPLAAEARFPENGLARFDIVALDGEGNRVDADNLTYRVVEEGRRFVWYQNEGRWDYKPVPQRVRVEGGSLAIPATGRTGARLESPIASGAYALEIADSEGRILAKHPFSAGWGMLETPRTQILPLEAKLVPTVLRAGYEAKIRLKLERPALVRTTIADDNVLMVKQELKPKGSVESVFTPSSEWGKKIRISVEADAPDESGAIMQARVEALVAPFGSATADFAPFLKKEIEEASSALLAAQSVKSGLQASRTSEGLGAVAKIPQGIASQALMALTVVDRIGLLPQKEWPPRDRGGEPTPAPNGEDGKTREGSRLRRDRSEKESGFRKFGGAAFVSPAPIAHVPDMLSFVLGRPSYTLSELAGTLRTLGLWKEALEQSGLVSESGWEERVRAETGRILNRQASDGGFAPMPGEDADIASTSAALSALSAQASPALAPAIAQAAEWLSRRLENAWFGENERPERALAYGALARAGKLDVASLRYFADTSADKELPPLASANVALAFSYDNDKNRAAYWIDKTMAAMARESAMDEASRPPVEANGSKGETQAALLSPSTAADPDVRPDTVAAWRALAENQYMNAEQAASEISRMAEMAFLSSANKRSLDVMNDLAGGMKAALNRFEPWRLSVRGVDKRVEGGIAVVSLPQSLSETSPTSRESPTIRNTSGKTLSIELAQWGRQSPLRANMTRKILNLDGSPTRGELKVNGVYVMLVEGQWPENEASGLLVVDEPGPLLVSQTCALHPANAAAGALGWLKDMNVAQPQYCERARNGVYVRLAAQRKDSAEMSGKSAGPWRLAWLAKVRQKGTQTLRPPILRVLRPGARIYEGATERVNAR